LRALAEITNAETTDDAARFLARWPGFLLPADDPRAGDPEPVIALGYLLRSIWREHGTPQGDPALIALLFIGDPYLFVLRALKWKRGLAEPVDSEFYGTVNLLSVLLQVSIDWSHGRLAYKPVTPLQSALHLLVQKSDLAKVCANTDCPAPYFIANRTIQKYCCADCMAPFRREWKMKWWDRHGDEWRAKRSKKKSGKGGKH